MIRVLRPAVAGLGMTATMAAMPAHACITVEEAAADQIRFIDMQLRVAALKCRSREPRLVVQYNRFVKAHRPSIIASRAPVERYVNRQAKLDMDDYVTKRANRLSYESIGIKGFCANTLALAATAARSADASVVLDLLPIRYQLPARLCKPSGGVTANAAPAVRSTLGATSTDN